MSQKQQQKERKANKPKRYKMNNKAAVPTEEEDVFNMNNGRYLSLLLIKKMAACTIKIVKNQSKQRL